MKENIREIKYQLEPAWPALAWLAECTEGSSSLFVRHGPRVETGDSWFCEGVWDGAFDEGGFDRTDIFFGSGARIRSGELVFVSSGSTVDRLQYLAQGNKSLVSNSLACIYAMDSSWLNPGFDGYSRFFGTVTQGIDLYERQVPDGGPILIYFNNLVWDGRQLKDRAKPDTAGGFASFEAYVGFLESCLARIGENARSTKRRFPLGLIGTLSTGYDSPTVTVLARHAGLSEVITFARSRQGLADSGVEIAEKLGIEASVVGRLEWQSRGLAEIPFIAVDGKGVDVLYAGAEVHLRNRVLFTGYHGVLWKKNSSVLKPAIQRGDRSGLSLTEYRLLIGMIHLPVTFMGVRHALDINQISRSEALKLWDVGGTYTKPICRRIVEGAGVPRQYFGQVKKATTNQFGAGDVRFTRASRSDYSRWREVLVEHEALKGEGCPPKIPWLGRGAIPEAWDYLEIPARRFIDYLPDKAQYRGHWVLNKLKQQLYKRTNRFFPWTFSWALDRHAQKYRTKNPQNL